ncbi:MAG: ELWxxDGT repeat protein, partial [Egibacteraceae bacterium]
AAFTIHRDGHVGFTVGDYDPAYPLVIDPTLDYATFLGGSGYDGISDIVTDGNGDVYVTGVTNSADFPATSGAFQEACAEEDEDGNCLGSAAFVAKLVPGGGEDGAVALEWATYLGGAGFDHGYEVVVDDDGVVYVVGLTSSDDFPTTDDAHQADPGGGFVTLLSPDGSQLVYSTYYAERIWTMAVDAAGMVYVGEERGGGITRIDPTAGPGEAALDRLVLTTGRVDAVIVDGNGFVYATGNRGTFEATAGAYREEPVGPWLVKLDWPAEGLGEDPFVYATYGIFAEDMAWNPRDDTIFLAGRRGGPGVGDANFEVPVTLGAMQTEHSRFFANHGHDVSVTEGTLQELDPAGNGADDMVYATMFGGVWTTRGTAVAATPEGTAWVAGYTAAGDFAHLTEGAFQPTSGVTDGFGFQAHGSPGSAGVLLHIDPAGRGEGDLLYGTALGAGGTHLRWTGVDVDADGRVSVAGIARPSGSGTWGEDAPIPPTYNAFQDSPVSEGDGEGFVLRLHPDDTEAGGPGDTAARPPGVEVGLVDDVHPEGSSQRPGPAAGLSGAAGVAADLTVVGETLFFTAYHPDHGRELWRTDGTPEGTQLVKDIVAGGDARPQLLTAAGDTLFFTANHPDHGRELWRSDGTAAGTVLVRDIYPGLTSTPRHMAAVGDVAFLDPYHPDHGASGPYVGRGLWRSDGTEAGTELVRDPYPTSMTLLSELTPAGGVLFFSAGSGTNNRLWVSDGTEEGTQELTPAVVPRQVTAFGDGEALFNAEDEHGRELWYSDGTPEGTGLVVDLNPEGSSIPLELSPVGEVAFFSAFAGTGEDDPHVPPSSVAPQDQHDDAPGRELWVTDGTEAGTELVADINLGGSSHPAGMTAVGNSGTVVFAATGEQGRELWRTA